jgi:hypothetical protein
MSKHTGASFIKKSGKAALSSKNGSCAPLEAWHFGRLDDQGALKSASCGFFVGFLPTQPEMPEARIVLIFPSYIFT